MPRVNGPRHGTSCLGGWQVAQNRSSHFEPLRRVESPQLRKSPLAWFVRHCAIDYSLLVPVLQSSSLAGWGWTTVRHIFRTSSLGRLREDKCTRCRGTCGNERVLSLQLQASEIRLRSEMTTTTQKRSCWRCEHCREFFLRWLAQCRVTTMISEPPAT